MATRYFIKPTAQLIAKGDQQGLLTLKTNFFNSRCENADLFIRNFTVAALIKPDADLSFVQQLNTSLQDSITQLREISNLIKSYQTETHAGDGQLTQISENIQQIITKFKAGARSLSTQDQQNLSYADVLQNINELIGQVRGISENTSNAANSVNQEYHQLTIKLSAIVYKINAIIRKAQTIARQLQSALLPFNTEGTGANPNHQKLLTAFEGGQLLAPKSEAGYFVVEIDYNDDVRHNRDATPGQFDTFFEAYFTNIHSEAEMRFNPNTNIVITPKCNEFHFTPGEETQGQVHPNQTISLNCKLWLIPISTFILIKTFANLNTTDTEANAKWQVNSASEAYQQYVANTENLYLKKIFIDPEADIVTLDLETVRKLRLDGMSLLWPKTESKQLNTKLSLWELIRCHFRDAKKHDRFGFILGGPRYEDKVKRFIKEHKKLTIKRNSTDKYDASVEALMDRINGFTGSSNSRLSRKISILVSAYLTDKFQFSLYDTTHMGESFTEAANASSALRQILKANQALTAQQTKINQKLHDNQIVLQGLKSNIEALNHSIQAIDTVLQNRQSAPSVNQPLNVGIAAVEGPARTDDQPTAYKIEWDNEHSTVLKVTEEQLNEKAVKFTIAKKLTNILFRGNVEIMGQTVQPTKLCNLLLSPIVQSIQYDVNDTCVVQSNLYAYFMGTMYMSLPYHQCFKRRNWWDAYHTPKSQIVFLNKAATWYYQAYQDICRDIFYYIGPSVNSEWTLTTTQKNLKASLREKVSSTNIAASYQKAYDQRRLTAKETKRIGSMVSYITAGYVYTGGALSDPIPQTHEVRNVGRLTTAAIAGSVAIPRVAAAVPTTATAGSLASVSPSPELFLSADNIDYTNLEVLAVSLQICKRGHYEGRRKTFELLLNQLFGNRVQQLTSNLNLGTTTAVNSTLVAVANAFSGDLATAALTQTVHRSTTSTQANKAFNLFMLMQMVYLKISQQKLTFNDTAQSQWQTEVMSPACQALSGTAYYAPAQAYQKKVAITACDKFTAMFADMVGYSKPSAGLTASTEMDYLGFTTSLGEVPGGIRTAINNYYEFYCGLLLPCLSAIQGSARIDLTSKIIKLFNGTLAGKTQTIVERRRLDELKAYLTQLQTTMASKSLDSYSNISLSLLVSCLALLLRISYTSGGFASSSTSRSGPETTAILTYCLPFFIFTANIISRVPNRQPLRDTLSTLDRNYQQNDFYKKTHLTLAKVYKFVRNLAIKDQYDNNMVTQQMHTVRHAGLAGSTAVAQVQPPEEDLLGSIPSGQMAQQASATAVQPMQADFHHAVAHTTAIAQGLVNDGNPFDDDLLGHPSVVSHQQQLGSVPNATGAPLSTNPFDDMPDFEAGHTAVETGVHHSRSPLQMWEHLGGKHTQPSTAAAHAAHTYTQQRSSPPTGAERRRQWNAAARNTHSSTRQTGAAQGSSHAPQILNPHDRFDE